MLKTSTQDRLESFIRYASLHGVKKEGLLNRAGYLKLNSLAAMHSSRDKSLTKEILKKAGFKVPTGILTSVWNDVQVAISTEKLTFPLVVKPNISSEGNLVFAGIHNLSELKICFTKVQKKYKKIVVEEFIAGEEYRFLVLNGHTLAVAKRSPAYIIGDGKRRIRDLLGTTSFDWEIKRYLKSKDLSLEYVPKRKETVIVRGNSNRSTGGIVENVTNQVIDKFKKIAERASQELRLGLVGIDMIIKNNKDIDSPYCILESNASPGFGIHRKPDIGEPIDPFPLILKAILTMTKK